MSGLATVRFLLVPSDPEVFQLEINVGNDLFLVLRIRPEDVGAMLVRPVEAVVSQSATLAVALAVAAIQTDDARHKNWFLDQIVRRLAVNYEATVTAARRTADGYDEGVQP